jgi:hypothetical protein
MARKDRKGSVEKPPSTKEPSFARWFCGHIFSLIRRHGDVIAFWIGVGYCVKVMATALSSFSGRASFADLKLSLLANVSFVWTVNIMLSGISIALYFRERRLHNKTRLRLATRVSDLERQIDPQRTSSNLTPEGLTRKEDE